MRGILASLVVLLLPSVGFSLPLPFVIYGDDDRLDYYQIPDAAMKKLADSVPALFSTSDLFISGGQATFPQESYQQYRNLCLDQPFLQQPTAAWCSGALVASDLVVTAGHCIKSDEACAETSLAFDYRLNGPRDLPRAIPVEKLYSCKRIIARKYFRNGADYALIQLDRPVRDREPISVNFGGSLKPGMELAVLGYPVGLPLKLAQHAVIREVGSDVFLANADTFTGNSGSLVFDPLTLKLEGVMVRGEGDFDHDPKRDCWVERRCDSKGCRGESVTRASVLRLPLSWATPEPLLEEAMAQASLADGAAILRAVVQIPVVGLHRRFELRIETYSRESGGYETARTFRVEVAGFGGQRGVEVPFSVADLGTLVLGAVKGRISLLVDGKVVDSETIAITAATREK